MPATPPDNGIANVEDHHVPHLRRPGRAGRQPHVSIFESSRIVEIVRYPEGGPAPAGSVMVVTFELDGRRFEIDRYWAKLTADGGQEGPCGWLEDRFGLSWQITPAGIGELLERPGAMERMMGMKKLSIAGLRGQEPAAALAAATSAS